MTKLIGIARVKNESDFIEYFVRHNSNILDELYVADDGSSDNTREILKLLKKEGLVKKISKVKNREYRLKNNHGLVMTEIMHDVAVNQTDDDFFIFPLDADEMLLCNRDQVFKNLDQLGPQEYGLIPWKTFVPLQDGLSVEQGIASSFRPLIEEQIIFHKAIVPGRYALISSILMGNHSIKCNDVDLNGRVLGFELGHFPVRSSNQIIRKALQTSHKAELRRGLSNECYHIRRIARKIRNLNYQLTGDDLISITQSYIGQTLKSSLSDSFDMTVFGDIVPIYEAREISPLEALDNLLAEVIKKINEDKFAP